MSSATFNPSSDRKFSRVRFFLPTLKQSWILFLVIVLVGGIFGSLPKLLSTSKFCSSLSLSYALMMLPALIAIYIFSLKSPNQKLVKVNNPTWGVVFPVAGFLMCALTVLALGVLTEPLASLIPMPDHFKKLFEATFFGSSFIDTLISVSILAPLAEEFICRGVMLRGMLEHTTPRRAIFWSAFIFAVLHLNPWQAIPAFLLGLFFGWIYYRTRSIWVVIFMHCVNNTSSLIAAQVLPEIDATKGYIDYMPISAYILLFSVAVLVVAFVLIYFNSHLDYGHNHKQTLSS